ncbi:unnamed protein product, partial [Brassica oleracea var. botrytis]
VVIYEDHSLYVWDVNKPTRCSMMISHSAGIRDIKNLSCGNLHSPTSACVARGCCEGVSFTTCSEDGTIRLWDLYLQMDPLQANGSSNASTQGTMHLASAGIFERDLVETCGTTRALAVSEDGKYLAAGDCGGNLHIYDLQESEYTCMLYGNISFQFFIGYVYSVISIQTCWQTYCRMLMKQKFSHYALAFLD